MNLILCNVSDAGVGVGWPLRLVCLVRRYIWTPAVNGVSDVYLIAHAHFWPEAWIQGWLWVGSTSQYASVRPVLSSLYSKWNSTC